MTNSEGPTPAALTEKEAAAYLAISPQFLRLSRHYGNRPGHAEGPPFIRLGGGRSIRYLKHDLDDWLQAHRCLPTPLPTDIQGELCAIEIYLLPSSIQRETFPATVQVFVLFVIAMVLSNKNNRQGSPLPRRSSSEIIEIVGINIIQRLERSVLEPCQSA